MSAEPPKSPCLPPDVSKCIISGAVKLKHAEPEVKLVLPDKQEWEAVQSEKAEHRTAIEAFDKNQLQHVKAEEKLVLPDKSEWETVKSEKEAHKEAITNFNRRSLNHTEPDVKAVLPTAEDFKQDQAYKQHYNEQVRDAAAAFDQSKLKKTEPNVTTTVKIVDGPEH